VLRQCELLGLARSSYYYAAAGESAENLILLTADRALEAYGPPVHLV